MAKVLVNPPATKPLSRPSTQAGQGQGRGRAGAGQGPTGIGAAPGLGAPTAQVMGGLGYSPDELEDLAKTGCSAFGPHPTPQEMAQDD